MIPRLDEIKARVAAAQQTIQPEPFLADLAWLIAEVERLQPNPLGCHIGQCRGDETGQLVTVCSFHRKVDENAKLRANLEAACAGLRWIEKHSVDDWGRDCFTPNAGSKHATATLARLGRGGT